MFFATRYKIIKDKASQGGRGAPRKWPYFSAMDDMLAGDPAVVPEAVEKCFPVGTSYVGEKCFPVGTLYVGEKCFPFKLFSKYIRAIEVNWPITHY